MNRKIAIFGIFIVMAMVFVSITPDVIIAGDVEQVSIDSLGTQFVLTNLTERDTIIITSDLEFTSENGVTDGNGTESDPYIIEGWEIDGSSIGYGIIIDSTSAYCIVRNCELYGARDQSESSGVYLYYNDNIVVENCVIYDNDIGVYIYDGVNIEVNECYIHDNGVVSGGGGIDFTGIDVLSSDNIKISSNYIANEEQDGIRMWYSDNVTIEENYIYNITEHGIDFSYSSYNIIRNNYISNCLNGMKATGTIALNQQVEYNVIYNNSIRNNQERGIYLYNTENNTFYWNNFVNNSEHVMEFNELSFNGQYYSNRWYDSTSLTGNYWDTYTGIDENGDGVGDTPIGVNDDEDNEVNEDPYPLVELFSGSLPEGQAEPEEPATLSDSISSLLIGILPVLIIVMLFKTIFKTMDYNIKEKKR